MGYDDWEALKSERSPYSSGVYMFIVVYSFSVLVAVAQIISLTPVAQGADSIYLLLAFGFGGLFGCFT